MLVAVVLQPLVVLASPCLISDVGPGAGLPPCVAGPHLALVAAEFALLGLLMAAVGLMVMPGMRLDLVEARADLAAAARRRALQAPARPVRVVPDFAMPLAFR